MMMDLITRAMRIAAKVNQMLLRVTKGFSLIVAPHGPGTTVTFNLPGRIATLLLVLALTFVAGLAFVGVTYTKIALLALETRRLRSENDGLRRENERIGEIEQELAHIQRVRQQIEVWAGILPDTLVGGGPGIDRVSASSNWWPRRYTYAIMKPFYAGTTAYPGGMMLPSTGWISKTFISDGADQPAHPGIDIVAPRGTSVRCVLDGIVRFGGWDEVYGNLIIVDHSDSVSTLYGHNHRLLVKEGDHVAKGQVIATVGSTGRSTAPHLHFEILVNQRPIDPVIYLDLSSN